MKHPFSLSRPSVGVRFSVTGVGFSVTGVGFSVTVVGFSVTGFRISEMHYLLSTKAASC